MKTFSQKEVETLKKELKAPYSIVQYNQDAVYIILSVDHRSQWPYDILTNSRFCKFHLFYNGIEGTIRCYETAHNLPTFKTITFRNFSMVAHRINKHLDLISQTPLPK